MFEQISALLAEVVRANPWLAPLAAFAGGTLTAANPCVIAAVPLLMAYLAGQEENRGALRSFLLSLTFAVGLTIMFALMALGVFAASSLLPPAWWIYIAAAVCLIMGLHLIGVLDFTIPTPSGVRPSRKGFVGALALGILFGMISMPCAGPVLAALTAVGPIKGFLFSATLLIAYSLGHCMLIIIGGTSMGFAQRLIDSRRFRSVNLWGKRMAGLVAMGVGIVLLAS